MRCLIAVLACVLTAGAVSPASAQTYSLVTSWDVGGDGSGGIALDAAGNVWLAQGTEVSKFGPTGTLLGGWTTPSPMRRIAIGVEGSVYLLGTNLDILIYDSGGTLVDTWSGIAHIDRGLSVDADGNVYVFVFVEGDQIQRISPDGTPQNQLGSFEIPQGIAVGPDGSVYGTDGAPNHFAVERFVPLSGTRLAAWGDGFAPREDGESGDGQFHTPYALDIAAGKVFVADGGNSRIQVFDESGVFLTKWSTTAIRGVAADPSGIVYLYAEGRIEKWAPSSDTPVHHVTWGQVKTRWGR